LKERKKEAMLHMHLRNSKKQWKYSHWDFGIGKSRKVFFFIKWKPKVGSINLEGKG
jgi:hypothetical protein